jgi:TonB family protein
MIALVVAIALDAAPLLLKEQPARPVGNAQIWVTTDDYPLVAARELREGTTTTQLLIGRDGVPRSCAITRSSGHQDLDAQACRSLMERARFIPATDNQGRNRSGYATRRVRWQLPEEEPSDGEDAFIAAAPPGLRSMSGYVVSYTLHTDGRVSNCTVQNMGRETAGEPPPFDCEALSAMRQPPAVDETGAPVVRQMMYSHMAIDIDPAVVPALPPAED